MKRAYAQSDSSGGFGEAGVREVLGLEQQAAAMLRDAQAEAIQIVASAREQADQLKSEMTAEANQEAEATMRESESQIEQQLRSIREDAEREAAVWERVAEDHLQEALAFVLDLVTAGGAH